MPALQQLRCDVRPLKGCESAEPSLSTCIGSSDAELIRLVDAKKQFSYAMTGLQEEKMF